MARQKREIHLCTKTINNIEFTSHEYKGGKYLITAKGYEGNRWVGYDTWEKRNDGDVTDGRSSFSPKNKRWFQASFKEIIGDLEDLEFTEAELLEIEMSHLLRDELYKNDFHDEKTGLRVLNRIYKKLAKQYHPDMGGDDFHFDALHKAYEGEIDCIRCTFDDRGMATSEDDLWD